MADARASEPSGWSGRWLRSEPLLLAAAVALPVLVFGLRMAASRWVPSVDDATIATRGYDVLSAHPPLTGQFSLASSDGPSTHSPGPLLYWLIALPIRFGPPWSVPVVMATVNALAIGSVVLLAWRRGGRGFAWATAIGSVALMRALGPVNLAEIWNPWAAFLPFWLLVFVCWSIACGARRLAPLAVLLASFAMQAHLTYVFPSVGLLLVALVGGFGAVPGGWRRDRGPDDEPDDDPEVVAGTPGGGVVGDDRALRRRAAGGWPLLAALAVAVACWALPIYEQLTRDPGNVTLLARSSGQSGARGGWDAVRSTLAHALGVPPQWALVQEDPVTFVRTAFDAPDRADLVVTALVLTLLVVALAMAVRRRDRVVVAGSAIALSLLAGATVVAASFPVDRVLVAGYTFRWFAIAGLVTWLMVGLASVRLPGPALVRRVPALGAGKRRGGVAAAAGVVGLAALVVVALAIPAPDPLDWAYGPSARLGDAVVDATEPGGRYLVGRSETFDLAFTPVVAHHLRLSGRHPVLMGSHVEAFGEAYAPIGERCDGIVLLQPADAARVVGARDVAEILVPGGPGVPPRMRVALLDDTSDDGLC